MLTLLAEADHSAYTKTVHKLIASGDKLEAKSIIQTQMLLRKFHFELKDAMQGAPWETATRQTLAQNFAGMLEQLGTSVDKELAELWSKGLEDYSSHFWGFYDVAGLQPAFKSVGANIPVAAAAANVYAEQLVGVTQPVVQAVTNQVQRIALGGGDYQEAIRRLMALEGTGGYNPIGPFRTIRQRAEADIRTEVHRVLNVAGEMQNEQLNKDMVGVRYKWVHLTKGPSGRTNHEMAANSEPIAMDERFYLGTDLQTGKALYAKFPHDPALPVGEVVNCRCKKLPVMDQVDREKSLAQSAYKEQESKQKQVAKAKQLAQATPEKVNQTAQAANIAAQTTPKVMPNIKPKPKPKAPAKPKVPESPAITKAHLEDLYKDHPEWSIFGDPTKPDFDWDQEIRVLLEMAAEDDMAPDILVNRFVEWQQVWGSTQPAHTNEAYRLLTQIYGKPNKPGLAKFNNPSLSHLHISADRKAMHAGFKYGPNVQTAHKTKFVKGTKYKQTVNPALDWAVDMNPEILWQRWPKVYKELYGNKSPLVGKGPAMVFKQRSLYEQDRMQRMFTRQKALGELQSSAPDEWLVGAKERSAHSNHYYTQSRGPDGMRQLNPHAQQVGARMSAWRSYNPVSPTGAKLGDGAYYYTSSGYSKANRVLREHRMAGNPVPDIDTLYDITDSQTRHTIEGVRAAIAEDRKIREALGIWDDSWEYTWRGFDFSTVDGYDDFMRKVRTAYETGQPFEHVQFMSTSHSPGFARGWASAPAERTPIVVEYKARSGATVQEFTAHRNEYEKILPEDGRYRVVSMDFVDNVGGKRSFLIQLEELD